MLRKHLVKVKLRLSRSWNNAHLALISTQTLLDTAAQGGKHTGLEATTCAQEWWSR